MMMKINKFKAITQIMVVFIVAGLAFTSCGYDDFVDNEFDYTAVYFPEGTLARSFIMEEGMQIGVGVVLGGRLSNTEDVEVSFSLSDDTVVTNAGFTVLPDSLYDLVDADGNAVTDKIVIPAGAVQGFVYLKANREAFLANPLTLGNNYALSFELESVVNADSILAEFSSRLFTFSYINKLYGYYTQGGQYVKTDAQGSETVDYPGGIDDVVLMEMKSPTTMKTTSYSTAYSAEMNIVLADDNTVSIMGVDALSTITDDGASYYAPSTRTLFLNYSYISNGVTYKATDELLFRNRVVDGVNQYNEDLINY